MGRHLEPFEAREIRVALPVEPVREQPLDRIAAVDARRQADRMQHHQPGHDAGRARPVVRRRPLLRRRYQPSCQVARRIVQRAGRRAPASAAPSPAPRCRRRSAAAPSGSASGAATGRGCCRPRCGCSGGARARAAGSRARRRRGRLRDCSAAAPRCGSRPLRRAVGGAAAGGTRFVVDRERRHRHRAGRGRRHRSRAVAQRDDAVQQVFQFAHVARKAVGGELGQRRARSAAAPG